MGKSALVSVLFFNNCLFLTHTKRQLKDHTVWLHWKHFQSASYRPDTTPSPEYKHGNTPVCLLVSSKRWPLRLRFFHKQMISWFSVLSTIFLLGSETRLGKILTVSRFRRQKRKKQQCQDANNLSFKENNEDDYEPLSPDFALWHLGGRTSKMQDWNWLNG